MSFYTSQVSVQGRIPPPDLIGALDDGASAGSFNAAMFNQIVTDVSNDIDGWLGSIFSVPFSAPYPAKVSSACLLIVCDIIYKRRLAPNEKSPFEADAKRYKEELIAIGKGEGTLDSVTPRSFAPGVAILDCVSMDMTSA